MGKRVNIAALLACMALLLFALTGMDAFEDSLRHDIVRQWLQRDREPWTGVLRVWHVTDWLPGRGSGETWFAAVGRSFEKQYHGVFIEVTGMTTAEASACMARGEKPDILSFPAGWGDPAWLAEIDAPSMQSGDTQRLIKEAGLDGHTLRALPVMRGAYVLLVNTDMASEREVRMPSSDWDMEWLQKAQTQLTHEGKSGKNRWQVEGLCMARNSFGIPELALLSRPDFMPVYAVDGETVFAAGNAAMCIGTLRTLYAQRAAEEEGAGVSFAARAVSGYTDMVQYAGVWADADGYRRVYAQKYVQLLLDDKEQKKLSSIGALPIAPVTEPMYEQDALMRTLMQSASVPKAFVWAQTHAQLSTLAQRAVTGDAAAKNALEEAMKDAFALVILDRE